VAGSPTRRVAGPSDAPRSGGRNAPFARERERYPRRTVRLIEIRLLEGPNVYRLAPVVKVEVAIGRRRTWYGQRSPGRHALVHLGADVPAREWPLPIEEFVSWLRRLRVDHGEGRGGVGVHRSSDPGHWIVTFGWAGAERARTIAEAALALTERDVSSVRRTRLTGSQERLVARWTARIADARATPPAWVRDADRRIPVASITGTNGKSTVTRLVTHILKVAGRRVGTTTSDGVLVDERLVEPGDWTGPGGAWQILERSDVDVGVLETARGGLVLRGMGYESNDASVVTNVTSDHLDLQGIHTLPELAEVKSTVARATRAGGWAVLNADDPLVAAMARRVRANVAMFSLGARAASAAVVRRAVAGGGRGYVLRDGWLVEIDGSRGPGGDGAAGEPVEHRVIEVDRVPITLGGLARHNVANALAAAGAARGLGVTLAQLRDGLADFQPSSERSPGRLNLFRVGSRIVIVDFAHNEAGVSAVLDVAEGIAGGAAGRAAPVTAIIGTAGDRPDDTLRGIGRIAGKRAQRIAIKETLKYLRGRSRESIVGEILAGVAAAGRSTADVPVYESETDALRSELARNGEGGAKPDAARVIVLMCHEEREEVFALLTELGARPIDVASELTTLIPRLQARPRRG
jgi:cyanophycin synthetase